MPERVPGRHRGSHFTPPAGNRKGCPLLTATDAQYRPPTPRQLALSLINSPHAAAARRLPYRCAARRIRTLLHAGKDTRTPAAYPSVRVTFYRFEHQSGSSVGSNPIAVGNHHIALQTMTVTPNRFNTIPLRIICSMETRPVPNTIALGGVATGIMNAQEQEIVTGTINSNGCTPTAIASPAMTGNNISVVARFDVNSVSKVIAKQQNAINRIGLTPDNPSNCWPIHKVNPDSLNPPANANPPPKSMMMFHGNWLAVSQSSTRTQGRAGSGVWPFCA